MSRATPPQEEEHKARLDYFDHYIQDHPEQFAGLVDKFGELSNDINAKFDEVVERLKFAVSLRKAFASLCRTMLNNGTFLPLRGETDQGKRANIYGHAEQLCREMEHQSDNQTRVLSTRGATKIQIQGIINTLQRSAGNGHHPLPDVFSEYTPSGSSMSHIMTTAAVGICKRVENPALLTWREKVVLEVYFDYGEKNPYEKMQGIIAAEGPPTLIRALDNYYRQRTFVVAHGAPALQRHRTLDQTAAHQEHGEASHQHLQPPPRHSSGRKRSHSAARRSPASMSHDDDYNGDRPDPYFLGMSLSHGDVPRHLSVMSSRQLARYRD